jgi:hypothetical protein
VILFLRCNMLEIVFIPLMAAKARERKIGELGKRLYGLDLDHFEARENSI